MKKPSDFDGQLPNVFTQHRVQELLKLLQQVKGLTQAQIADLCGIPRQHISELTTGKRTPSETHVLRLARAFEKSPEWLLGTSEQESAGPPSRSLREVPGTAYWLPLLEQPIQGRPREQPDWNGAEVELSPAEATKLATAAQDPYVLRFSDRDASGRLVQGDLLLIDQAPAPLPAVGILELGGRRLRLARQTTHGRWQRLSGGPELPAETPVVGRVLAILWGPLG